MRNRYKDTTIIVAVWNEWFFELPSVPDKFVHDETSRNIPKWMVFSFFIGKELMIIFVEYAGLFAMSAMALWWTIIAIYLFVVDLGGNLSPEKLPAYKCQILILVMLFFFKL